MSGRVTSSALFWVTVVYYLCACVCVMGFFGLHVVMLSEDYSVGVSVMYDSRVIRDTQAVRYVY